MFKKIILTTAFFLLGCTTAVETETEYQWDKFGIIFEYGNFDPFAEEETMELKVFKTSENTLIISRFEPEPVDMDFIYTRLTVHPDKSILQRIEELNKAGYKSVEVVGVQNFSNKEYTKVHIHSNIFGATDTDFYLTEFGNNVFEYQAGIYDYKLIAPILSSLTFTE